MKRPAGYLNLGPLSELSSAETFLPDKRFVVRRDETGLSAMSTDCTYDLSPLVRRREGDRYVFLSTFTTSKYADDGKVLQGPAVADLPYYEVRVESAEIGGPRNTVYVNLSKERPKEWRFPLPKG